MKKNKAELLIKRRKKLAILLKQNKSDCLLISKKENIFYLTNFKIDDALLVMTAGGKAVIYSDPRYKLELSLNPLSGITAACIYENCKTPFWQFAASKLKEEGCKQVCVEDSLNVASFLKLKEYLPCVKSIHHVVEEVRQIKDAEEIDLIKKAAKLGHSAVNSVKHKVKAGIAEEEIAFEFKKIIFERSLGKARPAFDVLVSSGLRSAMPHGAAGSKKIRQGECVLIDAGVKMDGYNSDLTRMVSVGRISDNNKKIIGIVKDAQRFAIEKVKAGVKISVIDKTARDFIAKKGYGKFFVHAAGHGVGLEVHEKPAISPANKAYLKAGMIFTIEPAIYIPETGGARIEDMILVTEKGFEVI
ncbi:MAG: Xaa-Pro peptidase family protein [Candidatus Omnitrophota bacterium]